MCFFYLIIGLVLGSFISALTYRIQKKLDFKKGRSFCDQCKVKISWYDNIPLLSYILLGGKCRSCKKPISVRYPLIEGFTGLLFVVIYNVFSSCSDNLSPICFWRGQVGILSLIFFLFISVILISIFVIDLESQTIPDNLALILFSFSFLLLLISDSGDFFERLFVSFLISLAFIGLHFITLGRGMGLGDSKLVLFSGIILGFRESVVFFFLSFIIGAIVGIILIVMGKSKFGKHIPFAPFLITSFFITLLWGDILIKTLFPYL